ncbi:hypothetical protein EVAR_16273_1 [Eumeta japonica]|uniref:Uncharacterized protein n=1 Tax=Eumeta variegata TaxID=151549 RepID=A0A4C1U5R2_EUMVA|nr:hypothetical protein EVAR_16273_1 [Eumeta japonica]
MKHKKGVVPAVRKLWSSQGKGNVTLDFDGSEFEPTHKASILSEVIAICVETPSRTHNKPSIKVDRLTAPAAAGAASASGGRGESPRALPRPPAASQLISPGRQAFPRAPTQYNDCAGAPRGAEVKKNHDPFYWPRVIKRVCAPAAFTRDL